MKIKLPENKSEITLGKYQRYVKLLERDLDVYSFNRRKLEIFTDLSFQDTAKVTQVDFEFCLNQIDKALNEEVGFVSRFKLAGIEFGFIPNINDITSEEMKHIEALDNLSIGEFVDSSNNSNSLDSLHKLLAVLFRPITNKDSFGNYEIAEYNGTNKYSELMKQVPLNVSDGALFFFINLSIELQNYIQKSMMEEQKKVTQQATTLKNGVGTLQ